MISRLSFLVRRRYLPAFGKKNQYLLSQNKKNSTCHLLTNFSLRGHGWVIERQPIFFVREFFKSHQNIGLSGAESIRKIHVYGFLGLRVRLLVGYM